LLYWLGAQVIMSGKRHLPLSPAAAGQGSKRTDTGKFYLMQYVTPGDFIWVAKLLRFISGVPVST